MQTQRVQQKSEEEALQEARPHSPDSYAVMAFHTRRGFYRDAKECYNAALRQCTAETKEIVRVVGEIDKAKRSLRDTPEWKEMKARNLVIGPGGGYY